MKGKMKLDVQAIQSAALAHGEKVAFALVGVVFVLFAYSAIQRERLDESKQPDKLKAMADQVGSHIRQSSFDPKRDSLALVDYVDRAKREEVQVDAFKVPTVLNQPLVDPKAKRDNPTLFAIEELRADSGYDVFSQKAGSADTGETASAGNQTIGRPYVVITGLIPWSKQSQDYARSFDEAQAFDSSRDRPDYQRLVVERAQIDPANPGEPDWQPVVDHTEQLQQLESSSADVVNSTFHVNPSITAALPILARAAWNDAATHPKIASAAAAMSLPAETQQPSRRPGVTQVTGSARPSAQRSTPAATSAQPSDPSIEYKLCRVFDFSVEPKKKYQYRVKAVLRNPNFNVAPQYLLKPGPNGGTELIETDWSNVSGTVTVPDRYGVLAGGVAEKSRADDPTVTLVATAIEPAEGMEAATQVAVLRGSVVNTIAPTADLINPRSMERLTRDNVPFITDIVVVDIYGGEQLSKRLQSPIAGPVEVLVVDPQGNLRVRSELADRSQVAHFVAAPPAQTARQPAETAIPGAKSQTTKRGIFKDN